MSHKDGFPNYYAAAGDVYEVADEETMLDLSALGLTAIPDIANNFSICVRKDSLLINENLLRTLYLQNNNINQIPENFFPSLPALMWLDLRDNCISSIPLTISRHPCLSHLLLQNNKLTTLPNVLATLKNLTTLKISENPIVYPPSDVLKLGSKVILKYLSDKFEEQELANRTTVEECERDGTAKTKAVTSQPVMNPKRNFSEDFLVKMSDKEFERFKMIYSNYSKSEGKCPKLAASRRVLPHYAQSRKYLPPRRATSTDEQSLKIRQACKREMALNKTKELLAAREKVLQDRKNMEMLKNWQTNYRHDQYKVAKSYKFDPKVVPYATDSDHMVLLSREDIAKDLPDKYRKMLTHRSKATVPRQRTAEDMVLANKIKQLFVNLEKINLNREAVTPRTEQRILMNEINKISEIKRKLSEMTHVNFKNMI